MAEDLDDGKQSKYVLDALRYTDFLPGAHYSVNIQKKRFYKLLVKKGLVYMYDNHYDLDPDSPILRNDGDEDDDDDDGVQTECTNSTNAEGFSSVGTTALPLPLGVTVAANVLEGFASIFGSPIAPMERRSRHLERGWGMKAKTKRLIIAAKSAKCSRKKTDNPKKVLIVGAGISGLAAAYELKRSGHKVIILERQQRVGGRIKTLHFDFQQSPELRGEAGAMRIPLEDRHYLTDAYIKKFKLKTKPFYNVDPEKKCFVSVRGKTVKINDFQTDCKKGRAEAKKMCDKLWPGWDKEIIEKCLREKYRIDHIIDYYNLTIQEVSESAPKLGVGENTSPEKYAKAWRKWLERWSKMSFTQFLSSHAGSRSKAEPKEPEFRPWPKIAIDCIRDINYIANPEVSVATLLAEEIGQWWTPKMKTLKNGMEELPEAFVKDNADPYCLEDDIHYGIKVTNVERRERGSAGKCCHAIKVSGRQTQTGNEVDFEADAVILTVPLNIMRQVKFSPPLPQDVNDAISGIRYEPSTKIFLGFRERFWEKGKFPIVNGGISRTDLPISQIVYPSKESCDEKSKRGVLLFYTWNKEALMFGSQPEDEALTEALRELQTVYHGLLDEENAETKVLESFEAGAIQSWYTDPAAQGAYVHLLPYSYMHHIRTLLEPKKIRPIFFGGEAISFANGWIQGAIASGLRAAWQFFKYNEKDLLCSDVEIPPFSKGPGPVIPQNLKMEADLPPEFSKYPFSI